MIDVCEFDGALNGPASESDILNVFSYYNRKLPNSYVEFLRKHNGGEGFCRDNYIVFWKAEEIITFNREYEVDRYAPGIVLFGSDGGGEGYGFDVTSPGVPVIRLPFIGMEKRYANVVTKDFNQIFIVLCGEQNETK